MTYPVLVHNWKAWNEGYIGVDPTIDPPLNPDFCFVPNDSPQGQWALDGSFIWEPVAWNTDGSKVIFTASRIDSNAFVGFWVKNGSEFIFRNWATGTVFLDLDGNPFSIPDGSGSSVGHIQWNEFSQRWYISIYTNSGSLPDTTYYYSEDDGATWRRFRLQDTNDAISFRGWPFWVDTDGTFRAIGSDEVPTNNSLAGTRWFVSSTETAPTFAGTVVDNVQPWANANYSMIKVGAAYFVRTQVGGAGLQIVGNRLVQFSASGGVVSQGGSWNGWRPWFAQGNPDKSFLIGGNSLLLQPITPGMSTTCIDAAPGTPSVGNGDAFALATPPEVLSLGAWVLFDVAYHPNTGWVAIAGPSSNTTTAIQSQNVYVYRSFDGVSWSDPFPMTLPANHWSAIAPAIDPSAVAASFWNRLAYFGGSHWSFWYKDIQDAGSPSVICFDVSSGDQTVVDGVVIYSFTNVKLRSKVPDLYLPLGDTGSPVFVQDIGYAGYVNEVVGNANFSGISEFDRGSLFTDTVDDGVHVYNVATEDKTFVSVVSTSNFLAGGSPNSSIRLTGGVNDGQIDIIVGDDGWFARYTNALAEVTDTALVPFTPPALAQGTISNVIFRIAGGVLTTYSYEGAAPVSTLPVPDLPQTAKLEIGGDNHTFASVLVYPNSNVSIEFVQDNLYGN